MSQELSTYQPQIAENPLAAMSGMGGNGNALAKLGQSREVTAVLASMFVAKNFPRDEMSALAKIKRACQRPRLAEMARYSYKRGTSIVEGPSIRIAEAVASAWGNIETGWREIERRRDAAKGCGVSTVESFAWDMETNHRKSLTFEVRHWRDTKGGGYPITDERDIYELCANQAARRIRACVLAIVPGDIIDEALAECDKTLASANKGKPLADRIRDMVAAFQNDHGVTREMIEARIQHSAESITEGELRQLRQVYAAIRDGMTTASEYFAPEKAEAPTSAMQAGPALTAQAEQPAESKTPTVEPEVAPEAQLFDEKAQRLEIVRATQDICKAYKVTPGEIVPDLIKRGIVPADTKPGGLIGLPIETLRAVKDAAESICADLKDAKEGDK